MKKSGETEEKIDTEKQSGMQPNQEIIRESKIEGRNQI